MPRYKICVYAISKNEEQFVDRWMDAVSEADLVVVVDTGSTDNTVRLLRERGAVVYEEKINPWRFDDARNIAIAHIPEDVDICVSNDLDEVFEPGWRQKLEDHWQPCHTRARYWFVWSYHPDGTPDKKFSMEKIHRRHGFRWVRPVHEVLEYSGSDPDDAVFIADLILRHYPDTGKPRSQYLPLLELSVEENPQDDRAMFWLGREYYYYNQYDDAIQTLQRHLELPTARWNEERSASMRFIALAYSGKEDWGEAQRWLLRAAAECPAAREPWMELARLGYGRGNWPLAFFAAEQGLAIRRRSSSYLVDPAAWGHILWDLGAIACYHLQMYAKAKGMAEEALRQNPADQRLGKNLALIREKADGGKQPMGGYKVCVYAICKNEEQFVDRWMDSMDEADLVVVTDTGSTDGTVGRLRARGAVVYEETIVPWRFDNARNRSLGHVPEDVDICVCTDLDEVFEAGWREKLESAWTPEATMGNYLFNWSLKPDGTPDTQFTYFKVHNRRDYVWAYPIHECLKYTGKGGERKVFIPGMVLNHYPDNAKSRGSYLTLLELAVAEDPASDRMTYYLGREYLYVGRWQACIDTLKRFLELPTATWREERCAAMRWIAKSYISLENKEEAYGWYYRAIAEMPAMRDPYVECAQAAYRLEDWPTVFFMTTQALEIQEKSGCYVNMGYAWDHTPHDLAAIACYRLGIYEKALYHARAALEATPGEERLANNLRLIEAKCQGK